MCCEVVERGWDKVGEMTVGEEEGEEVREVEVGCNQEEELSGKGKEWHCWGGCDDR